MNFDPLRQNAFHGWAHGNFDGDGDIDIGDIFRVIGNFAPFGYSTNAVTDSAALVTDDVHGMAFLSSFAREGLPAVVNFPKEAADRTDGSAASRCCWPSRSSAARRKLWKAESPGRPVEYSVVGATFEMSGRRHNLSWAVAGISRIRRQLQAGQIGLLTSISKNWPPSLAKYFRVRHIVDVDID